MINKPYFYLSTVLEEVLPDIRNSFTESSHFKPCLREFYICVGKNSPYVKYLDQFDKVMTQMVKGGTVDHILRKYK